MAAQGQRTLADIRAGLGRICEDVDALLCATPAAAPTCATWQPIETVFDAVRPNQHWLGWCPEVKCVFALVWHYSHEDARTPNKRVFGMVGGGYLGDTPTHWMPLPLPPAAEGHQ